MKCSKCNYEISGHEFDTDKGIMCGEKDGVLEVIDDDSDYGMSMVCKDCHPDQDYIKEFYEE